ncbi:MAG: acetyl-CoA carboxylase biotin carboxyl carrier protein [Thermoleophilia bacterium]|nr:acetyl-CoA carboxylase biotin carboxyl carrier protein [Thermoleophilia bacterium]
MGELVQTDEDLLLGVLAPETAAAFLARRRQAAQLEAEAVVPDTAPSGQEWLADLRGLEPTKLRELVALLEASNVDELTLEHDGTKVTLRKTVSASGEAETSRAGVSPALGSDKETPEASAAAGENGLTISGPRPAMEAEAGTEAEGRHIVRATMVGTFYRASTPGAAPFVEVGQRVKPGDVLCVLKAMKLMNEVVSEVSGTVAAVLVEDGAPVEFGQPLFLIDLQLE